MIVCQTTAVFGKLLIRLVDCTCTHNAFSLNEWPGSSY